MCRWDSSARRRRYKSQLSFVLRQLSWACCRPVRGGTSVVAEQPLLAGACEEKIFGDVKLVPLGDLDGPSFDEPSTFQRVHGMAGEMGGATGLHLEAEVAWAEAGAHSFEIDDRKGHNFIGSQIFGEFSSCG
jgi:hypothetical protein